jgi:probable F420-dependent oxidoreductase
MKLGINFRNWGPHATPENLMECARIADQSSLDSIWLNDHIGFPPGNWNNEYGLSDDMGSILDPLAVLAFLAAATKRIKLGTGVLILPYRPKLPTAKLLATAQVLSNERLIIGVGPGYMAEEFTALGVDRTKRGKITDETLNLLRAAFEGGPVIENGQELVLKPQPARPPFLIGGAPQVAIPRAVRAGDGWIPVGMLPDELKPHISDFDRQASDAGRQPLDTVVMKTLPIDDPRRAADIISAYEDAGVTRIVHTQDYSNATEYGEIIEQVTNVMQSAAL